MQFVLLLNLSPFSLRWVPNLSVYIFSFSNESLLLYREVKLPNRFGYIVPHPFIHCFNPIYVFLSLGLGTLVNFFLGTWSF